MTTYHIAQFNIAKSLAPLDDPKMADFVSELDRVNKLADKTSGFVWRLQGANGEAATSINPYDDNSILINYSVWEDIQSLHEYTYSGEHMEIFKQRKKWFGKLEGFKLVMWWIPAGTIPTIEEGQAKLAYLNEHGVTPQAFTFSKQFTVEEFLATETD